MKIKARIWVETDRGLLVGKGRYRLLLAIREHGSINRAAKALHLSYKKAWRQIDDINANAPDKVVVRSTGGKGGGGTRLTSFGESLIEGYEALDKACNDFLKQQAEDIFSTMENDGS